MRVTPIRIVLPLVLTAVLVLAGCGEGSSTSSGSSTSATTPPSSKEPTTFTGWQSDANGICQKTTEETKGLEEESEDLQTGFEENGEAFESEDEKKEYLDGFGEYFDRVGDAAQTMHDRLAALEAPSKSPAVEAMLGDLEAMVPAAHELSDTLTGEDIPAYSDALNEFRTLNVEALATSEELGVEECSHIFENDEEAEAETVEEVEVPEESSSNGDKIEAAESEDASQQQVEAELWNNLLTESEDVAVGGWDSPSGHCSVDLVATGETVAAYEEDDWFITSPDHQAGLKVVPTQGTNVADCLREAAEALGWES